MPTKTKPWAREQALKLLAEHPTWSNKDIANQVPGLSAQAVAMYRLGHRPPTRATAAPKTAIDPNPRPTIELDTTPDIGEAEPPPPGAEYQPLPDVPERPHLHSGTSALIDQLVPSLAQIATAIALRAAPERVRPLVPSPQVAEVLVAAPARIAARHSHIQVDELSEDGRDIAAMFMALGAWGLEIRANLEAVAQMQQQQAGQNGARHDNGNGNGYATASPGAASVHGAGYAVDPPAGIFAAQEPVREGAGANGHSGGAGRPGRNGQAAEPDPTTGRQLMAGLYTADASGRRRLGLQ